MPCRAAGRSSTARSSDDRLHRRVTMRPAMGSSRSCRTFCRWGQAIRCARSEGIAAARSAGFCRPHPRITRTPRRFAILRERAVVPGGTGSLMPEIQRTWEENSQVYGVRKVWRQMRREGFDVARSQALSDRWRSPAHHGGPDDEDGKTRRCSWQASKDDGSGSGACHVRGTR